MKTIFAIAQLTIRSALRLRVFVSLFALLLALVVVVPRSLVGDGSLVSEVRILFSHTLGMGAIILSLATLWAACASVSQEVSGKQIRLLAVKPVGRAQLWIGKWLGIVLLDAALLVLLAAAVWVGLLITMRADGWTDADRERVRSEVLVARRRYRPQAEDVTGEVSRRLQVMKTRGQMPAGTSECEVYDNLVRAVTAKRSTVSPGTVMQRRFELPARAAGRALSLRYRLVSAIGGAGTVAGTWYVGTEEEPRRFSHAIAPAGSPRGRIPVPAGAIDAGAPVVVSFAARKKPHSMTAILQGDRSIELLAGSGRFLPNYGRALLIILCLLAALAALGVTAGTFFSFPVAAFSAFAVALIVIMAHFFVMAPDAGHSHHGHDHGQEAAEPSPLTVLGESTLRAVSRASSPVAGAAPLGRLCDGVAIPWSRVGRVLLTFGLGYPLLLCGVGGWCLKRRELAA